MSGRPEAGGVTPPPAMREEAVALAALIALIAITTAWWALAFWPVQNAAPVWLARTRWVCFGVADNGLPDASGWIGLIGGPLGMAAMLMVGWGSGVRGVLRRLRRGPGAALLRGTFALMAAGLLLVVGGAGVRVRDALAAPPADGTAPVPTTYPRLDRAAPPLDLVAHTGARFERVAQQGQPVLVTFAYGHCATVCPVIVRRVLAAQAELASTGTDVRVAIVTLDPWRDTPSRLAGIAEAWSLPSGAMLLGGSIENVERTLDAWEVPRSRDAATGELAHPSLVYIVDDAGRIAYASNGDTRTLVELVGRL